MLSLALGARLGLVFVALCGYPWFGVITVRAFVLNPQIKCAGYYGLPASTTLSMLGEGPRMPPRAGSGPGGVAPFPRPKRKYTPSGPTRSSGLKGPAKRGEGGGEQGERKSAPEEFLLILTQLRVEAGQVVEYHESMTDEEDEQHDIAEVITLVRAMATESWDQARSSAHTLSRSPLMDTMLSRMLLTAATQAREPGLALKVLAGMRERRVYPDAYMLALVLKSTSLDPHWQPVIEVIKSQLASLPGGLPQDPSRRHQGFLRALASAVERGKFFSSSFLVDALLHFRMVDGFTLKVALKFYRFSRTPARALPWITAACAVCVPYDEDLAFEMGRVYKSLNMWREGVALLEQLVRDHRDAVQDKHVGVAFSTCHQAGEWQECLALLSRLKRAGITLGSIPCLILLRLLLEHRKMSQSQEVVEWMASTSNPLDLELARLVLLSLAKTGPLESSVDFLCKLMPAANVTPDITCFTSVLRACVKFKQPDAALCVYSHLRACHVCPDVLACVSVLDALMEAQRYDEALSFYAQARRDGVRPDIKGYTQVLRLVALAERWDLFQTSVQEAVRDSKERNFRLDHRFFATVINACAEAGRPDEALSVLHSVSTYGLTPNIFCYGAAAKACLTKGRWREALSLLDDARNNDVPPDAPLYRAVLRCCWRARQWQSVVRLCAEMRIQGLDVDEGVYTQLMDTLARAGQTQLALESITQLVASGVMPSAAVVCAFLRGYYEKGEYDEAWQCMDTLQGLCKNGRRGAALGMGATGLQDLMAVCVRREDWQEVLHLCKRWEGPMPMLAHAHVARAHAELNHWRQAEEQLIAMERDFVSCGVAATRVLSKTYSVLLCLCAKRMLPQQASALLGRMEKAQLSIDAEAYHYALDAAAQTGLTKEVWSLFAKLRSTPSLTPRLESFTVMLELCAREGNRAHEAVTLMQDLQDAGLQPDIMCLNAAMNAVREAAFLEEDPQKAAILRGHLSRWRQRETMHTYNSEIAVLAMQKTLIEGSSSALRLLKEMADNGIPRDTDSFNMGLEVCSRADDLPATLRVFEELRGQETCEPNVFSYLTVAIVLLRHGQWDQGLRWLHAMTEQAPSEQGGDARYYSMLWPHTYKALHKALLSLAEQREQGEDTCRGIVKVMQFLRDRHDPPFDADSLAEQLATRRLCTGYIAGTRLTGGAFDSDPLLQPHTL